MPRAVQMESRRALVARGGRPWLPVILFWLWGTLGGTAQAAGKGDTGRIDFNFEIRPILSDRCFACHGPDDKGRKGKLRLDTAEGAAKIVDEAKGIRAITPGDPAKSEVFLRVTSRDPEQQMPPPESKLSLSAREIELLRRWIEQGAPMESRWWSFSPVKPAAVPEVAGVRNPVDAFVRERLRREGLEPAAEATRETLIRRLSLDLIGLPPTPAEVEAFRRDRSPDAYERLVERYLEDPGYGERMATDWLDVARYADTYGYQADVERDMSPWRDWVIRSFNANLPFDQFILWQIAGDLLPGATRDQRLATAFNRLHRQTNEGGSIEEEFRAEYVADRVHTFGTAFLGLTLECARCHDHKYDPIPQRDYYRFFAFFNNIEESGLYSHFTRATPTPAMFLYPPGGEAKHDELRAAVAGREQALRQAEAKARETFRGGRTGGAVHMPDPEPAAVFAFESVETNRTANGVAGGPAAELHDQPALVEGRMGRGLEFSGDNEVVMRGVGEFGRTDPFSFALWIRPAVAQERAVVFHRSRAWTDSGSRGYELLLEEGRPSFALVHFYPGNAIRIRATEALPTNEWSHLVITYDGSSRAEGLRLYRNGEPLASSVVRDQLYLDIQHRGEWGDADVGGVHLTLAGRFRDSGFKQGRIDEFRVYDRALTAGEAARVAGLNREPTAQELEEYYVARLDAECERTRQALREERRAENGWITGVREIMVMEEAAERRPAFVLKRGQYSMPGERVEPGTPEGILPLPAEYPANRLGLARWLVDPRNPLTARVAVNRIWRMHFGRGIVATQEDFGSQGRLPTHPELMDWLAFDFMRHGWDVKRLHRQIVTSATYRQSSRATAEQLAADPENRWLARGPKHRLSAEQLRDSALAASGLLSRRAGGPSVKPYQPAGLWEESGTGKSYVQDRGEKLYRRSLYTFWRRTAPPPTMLTFDATAREVCTAKRETTSTPLQALVLLNDPQFVEAARVLGEEMVRREPRDAQRRLVALFQRLTARRPDAREEELLGRLYREQLELFRRDPDGAERFLSIGEKPHERLLPHAEVAATTVVASAVMSHDDAVMKK